MRLPACNQKPAFANLTPCVGYRGHVCQLAFGQSTLYLRESGISTTGNVERDQSPDWQMHAVVRRYGARRGVFSRHQRCYTVQFCRKSVCAGKQDAAPAHLGAAQPTATDQKRGYLDSSPSSLSAFLRAFDLSSRRVPWTCGSQREFRH